MLAQLVARFNGIEEVRGSTPLHSTIFFKTCFQQIREQDPRIGTLIFQLGIELGIDLLFRRWARANRTVLY